MTGQPAFPASRRVFLTGASSGIGLEIARHLARDGHHLALSARREAELREAAAALSGGQSGPLVLPCDVTDSEALTRTVARAEREMGPLDTLVYSAGGARFAPLEETTDAIWDEMLAANLTGLFYCTRAIVPYFRERGRGQLVFLLSIASRVAFPGSTAYTAAKHGALGFVDSLRAEVRGFGIHVTSVLPGATDTHLWDDIGGDFDRSRMMQPEQVARVVASALRETTSGMIEEIRIGPVGGAL